MHPLQICKGIALQLSISCRFATAIGAAAWRRACITLQAHIPSLLCNTRGEDREDGVEKTMHGFANSAGRMRAVACPK